MQEKLAAFGRGYLRDCDIMTAEEALREFTSDWYDNEGIREFICECFGLENEGTTRLCE